MNYKAIEPIRVLSIQYAGDYREAVERFSAGGDETYYAQKYSVDAVGDLSKQAEAVSVLVCLTEEPYNTLLSNGVRAIGTGFSGRKRLPVKDIIRLIEQQAPTHLIVRTPITEVFQWAIKHQVKTLAILADSFSTQGLRDRWNNYQLTRLLNHSQIEWVANHGINASRSLAAIGVNPDKIVPWDWPPVRTPDAFAPKTLNLEQPRSLFYAGAITEAKGVGDVLDAVAALKSRNLPIKLRLAGKGDIDHFTAQAQRLNIADAVEFLGLVPNHAIVQFMRAADAVVIPSRHDYPEGLPMTIYEALCSRTPIVASDHPMFAGRLNAEVSALIFPARNSAALAQQVERLFSNPELYQTLSANSEDAWKQIQIPVKFADLMHRWLFEPQQGQSWLFDHRLSSPRYAESQNGVQSASKQYT